MSQADLLQQRLIEFAVDVERVLRAVPRNRTTTHIVGQLLRSCTSPAPNYAEARSAESLPDFIHKLGVVLKELNESMVWCRMLKQMEYGDPGVIVRLETECNELCRIIAASIKTATARIEGRR
jgi:four helix bundle protein